MYTTRQACLGLDFLFPIPDPILVGESQESTPVLLGIDIPLQRSFDNGLCSRKKGRSGLWGKKITPGQAYLDRIICVDVIFAW